MRILRVLGMLVIGTGLAVQMTAAAHAEHRLALVVGNSDYRSLGHLGNPANDAKLIADALKADGFDVTLANNLDHDGLVKALRGLGTAAHDADWAVVYYAGRGVEIGGTSYLVPVDAKLATDHDVGQEAVSLDQVLTAVKEARSLRVVILDASRDNPFAAAGKAAGHGSSSIEPVEGTVVAYATAPGGVVADSGGANGAYAMALAKHLADPKLEISKLFRILRDEVVEASKAKQLPFFYGSLPAKEFYFHP